MTKRSKPCDGCRKPSNSATNPSKGLISLGFLRDLREAAGRRPFCLDRCSPQAFPGSPLRVIAKPLGGRPHISQSCALSAPQENTKADRCSGRGVTTGLNYVMNL